ncbi:MAG: DUF2505 family protein [Pseudomonadota bacterium]
MAKKEFKFEEKFDVPREKLIEFILDTGNAEARAVEFGKALEAKATREDIGDGRARIVVRSKEYGRGMDGRKDMTKTQSSTFIEEWDLERYEATWSYAMESTFADKIMVGGNKKLVATGDGSCTYKDDATIEVKIPVIGGMIAGKVVSSMERSTPRMMEWMKNKLNER